MNEIWKQSQENGGVCGADGYAERDPDMTPIRNDYRWTPACQRAFLQELVCTGSVTRAVKHVAKSPRSAYALRYRRDGAAFRLGWDAAILVARDTLHDMLMDRAVCGYEEVSSKQDDGTTVRGKYDNRLGQGLLSRLDRLAEAQAAKNCRLLQVQLVCQDFENFLDLIENGGKGAEAALFFAARDEAPLPRPNHAIECELARISAAEAAQTDLLDMEPEAAAAALSVWYDDEEDCWKTNFPPLDADDAALVEESSMFGEDDYERTLTPDEEEAQIAAVEAEVAPWREAALKAREAWFGWKAAA